MSKDKKIKQILSVISELTSGNLAKRIDISSEGDELDLIAEGLNGLAEELLSITVSQNVLHKITGELRRSQSVSRDNEERLRAIVNTAGCGIINIDQLGIIENLNIVAEKLFQYSEAYIVGNPVSTLIPDFNINSYSKNVGSRCDVLVQKEFKGIRADSSSFFFDLTLSQIVLNESVSYTLIIHDLTDRIKIEHDLKKTSNELMQAHKTKDKFLSIVAHDLKGPVAKLVKMSHLLRDDVHDLSKDEIHDYSSKIFKSSLQLNRMMRNVLDWTRLQGGDIQSKPITFDISVLLRSALATIQEEALQKNVHIDEEIDKDVLVYADVYMLEIALNNLLSNAMKFTTSGDTIKITAKHVEKGVEISIVDNGIGIPEEELKQLFNNDVINSNSISEDATRLEIALSQEYLNRQNSSLEIKNRWEGGVVSCFTLPIGETDTIPVVQEKKRKSTILVADDDPMNLFIIKKLMKKIDYKPICVSNGVEVINALKEQCFDIILMDIQMPEKDGLETSQEIISTMEKETRPKIIAWTSSDDLDTRRKCSEIGMDDFCSKDITVEELQKMISKWEPQSPLMSNED